MNVVDAAYCVGRDYPGGAEALALRMGRPNLSDELNPRRTGAKLGIQDATTMQVLAGDFRVLTAMAAECRFLCVPLPAIDSPAHGLTAEHVAKLAKEFAELMSGAVEAFADGQITGTELQTLEREGGHLVASLQALLKHAVQLHRACAPKERGGEE